MVLNPQQIENLINKYRYMLTNIELPNIVSFKLSDILNHVNETLSVGDVLESIYDYNLTHEDNKFPDEYIIQLWEFNMQVNKIFKAIIKYRYKKSILKVQFK